MISKSCTKNLFDPLTSPALEYPNTSIYVCWERLIAKRALVLATIDEMPPYLLMPEVMELLNTEKNPTYRLIMDIMWTTGARISEVLALTSTSFNHDGYDFGVILKTLKQRPGRPTKASLQRSSKRYVPINDQVLQDRILSYIYAGHFTKTQRIFPMSRQTVYRHIRDLVERVGGHHFLSAAIHFGIRSLSIFYYMGYH